MHELYDTLEELCEKVSREIEEANEKLGSGSMSAGDLEYVDKLTHTLKSIKTTLAMMGEGYSGDSYGNNSYAMQPRGGYTRRGRYSGRYNRRYSRDNGLTDELRELMQDAPDERTKQEFRQFISRIENL